MKTTTKTVILLAALAILTVPTAVDAASSGAAHDGAGHVYCQDLPGPLHDPWRLACGTIAGVCARTNLCR